VRYIYLRLNFWNENGTKIFQLLSKPFLMIKNGEEFNIRNGFLFAHLAEPDKCVINKTERLNSFQNVPTDGSPPPPSLGTWNTTINIFI
jgi:hypothetical protein